MHFLSKQKVWVFDGAMGTMLQQLAEFEFTCPDELNLTQPDVVLKVHQAYIKAGSDIIQTNTFGANYLRLKRFGLESKTYEINKRAVEIAHKASSGKIVAASIGPLGELIEPFGDITKEEAFNSYIEQAKGLDEVDFINVETVQSLDEAEIIIKALREILALPISITVTFQKSPRGYFTMMGESILDFVNRATQWDVQAIGTNCGEGFEQSLEIICEMKNLTNLPLIAKPNAGIPQFEDGKIVYRETPDFVEPLIEKFFNNCVKILGGCCGTTPEHIKAIKRIANKINFDG
ncbi:MAG: homocysteine S-methyltransferase family protein [Ignavibacteria bacterium]|nr:homocysteine S-methyltransferase family protein [Ignavibacteria bacterium]